MVEADFEKIVEALRFRLSGGHGSVVDFDVCTPERVAGAIKAAVTEYVDAVDRGAVAGCGGQIDELGRLAAVAIEGIAGLVAITQRRSDRGHLLATRCVADRG